MMKAVLRWIRWASPWAALGLAAALLAIWFQPELLQRRVLEQAPAPTVTEAGPAPATGQGATSSTNGPAAVAPVAGDAANEALVSYADAVERSAPAVVNVYSERVVRVPRLRNLPPEWAPYFGDMWNSPARDEMKRQAERGLR